MRIAAQNQFLAQLRQRHMEQQQVAAQEAARQQELQQRMLATLNPQQVQQLQAMPKVWLLPHKQLGSCLFDCLSDYSEQ